MLSDTWKYIRSLLALTMGGFTIGLTEYLIMGLLPEVATSLTVSIPAAGYLIAIYALGVVMGAPLLISFAGKISPKRLLALLMLICFIFHALFCCAPNYPLLLITRFLAGLPHGAFFGVGAVVAATLARPGKEASAVAMMFTGLTLANCIGVPAGTAIGHAFGWRAAYIIVTASALVTLLLIIRWLPNVQIRTTENYWGSFKIFKKTEIWLIIGMSSIGTAGTFTWISYIAPYMLHIVHLPEHMMSLVMMTAGLGMIAGNYLGGILSDRITPLAITGLSLLAMILCLQMVALVTNPPLAFIMTFITGIIAFTIVPAMQMLMINAAEGAEMLASASVQASANMSNTLGAFLGGLPLTIGFGFTSPLYVGMSLAACGCVLCLALKYLRTQELSVALEV